MFAAARSTVSPRTLTGAVLRRGLASTSPARNSETTLLRSTELGAVEETQDIATMDRLLRTLRMWTHFAQISPFPDIDTQH